VGWGVPVVRATVMGSIAAMAFLYRGTIRVFPVVVAIAWGMLIWMPDALLLDASFGLSFGATIGILLFGEYWTEKSKGLSPLLRALSVGVGIPLSATIGSLPALIYHF